MASSLIAACLYRLVTEQRGFDNDLVLTKAAVRHRILADLATTISERSGES